MPDSPLEWIVGAIIVVWIAALIKTGYDRSRTPGGRWRR